MTWRMSRRLWSLVVAAMSFTFTPLVAAVPETVIKVIKVENGVMTYQNTGMVPLGAVFVRSALGDVQWADYSGQGGMKPGATETFPRQGDNATTANTEITTVIFQTGQVLGERPKRQDGTDVVQEVFDYRTGQVEAWAEWEKIINDLPTDHVAAFKQFLAKIDALQAKKLNDPMSFTGTTNYVEKGRRMVEKGLYSVVKSMEVDVNSGAHDAAFFHGIIKDKLLKDGSVEMGRMLTKETR